MLWPAVVVIGRLLVEPGTIAPPAIEDSALLLIKRENVVICPPPVGDAGVDAGVDAGDGGIADAGIADAGLDAGVVDAGLSDAGVCTTFEHAVTMILEPNVSVASDGTRFAVLLVTPDRPLFEVKQPIFDVLASVTDPKEITRTVYIEDAAQGRECRRVEYSGGGGCLGVPPPSSPDSSIWDPPGIDDAGLGDGGLVEETVGPYQFVRAKPSSSGELAAWLAQLGYAYKQQDLDAVGPYIDLGYHVVAMRVTVEDANTQTLPPIALTWPGTELRIPAALGNIEGATPQLFTVYIAADDRYEFAGATVRYGKMTSAGNMGYLTRSEIVLDQDKPPSQDPIATRRPYSADYEEVIEHVREVRVPLKIDCEDDGCCRECNAKPKNRFDLGLIIVAVAFVLRRRRR